MPTELIQEQEPAKVEGITLSYVAEDMLKPEPVIESGVKARLVAEVKADKKSLHGLGADTE
jgi:hypothetical protein